jgi:hypothetical protein
MTKAGRGAVHRGDQVPRRGHEGDAPLWGSYPEWVPVKLSAW